MAVSRAEWLRGLGLSAGLVALGLIPHALATLGGPADRVHIGAYWFPQDFSQYLAAMNEGASSDSWLVHNHFSAEPHEPAFMYPLYVAVGKLAAATGLPTLAIYRATETATRALLPLAIYWFAATFVVRPTERLLATLLALFGGGVGVWLAAAGAIGFGPPPEPLNVFLEALTFGAILAAPHLGLGLAAALVGAGAFARALAGSGPPPLALATLGGAILALALTHPFGLPPLLAALGLCSVGGLLMGAAGGRPALLAAAVSGLIAAPLLAYSLVTFGRAPFWSETYGAQNLLPSPPPWALPRDYGVVLLLAGLGLWRLRTGRSIAQSFLALWIAVMLVAMYLPAPYQRRFAFGLQPALAVLAALGWPIWRGWVARGIGGLRLADRAAARLTPRLAGYPLALLAVGQTVFIYAAICLSAVVNRPLGLYAVDTDTHAAGQWIAAHSTPEDVTLASFPAGNALAGLVPGRVVAGHEVATLRAGEKRAAIQALYRGELAAEPAWAFLKANRVSYLLVGAEERALGGHDPGWALGLPLVAEVGAARVYAVRPPRG